MMEYILLSLKNIYYRKTRAFLTLLGVIIGIAAVVSMVAIGTGMKAALKEQLEVLGSDKIIVSSSQVYGVSAKKLTDDDSDAIANLIGVNFVSPMVSVAVSGEFRGEEKVVTVWGLEPEKAERTFAGASGYEVTRGRWLEKGDKGKIAIGYKIHEDYFDRQVNIGNTIKIQGMPFRVIGIFEKTGDIDSDTAIYADLNQVRELFGMGNSVTMIIVRVKQGYSVEDVGKRIEDTLERRRGEKDFEVLTPMQIVEQVGESFKIVQIVFGGIAAVSLLVGAIGIANTMIMNVLERTQEIGVMKAVGATRKDITKIFLAEAGVIGFVGGSIGIVLGFAISKLINIAAEKFLGPGMLFARVSPEMALFAISFSCVIGVISGIYPAYRATKLDPVEALRGRV